jgi:branched-chain amino acid transport system substrate-binding protein
LGALGYEAALVLIDAIKRAGKNDPTAIRDAIAATKDFEGVTGKITIDAQRNPEKSAVVLKVDGGKAKFETSIAP